MTLRVPEKCRFCTGSGTVTVELGGDEKEVSKCINCEGLGSFTCTTCQGSGIQPRYLDRRYVLGKQKRHHLQFAATRMYLKFEFLLEIQLIQVEVHLAD